MWDVAWGKGVSHAIERSMGDKTKQVDSHF